MPRVILIGAILAWAAVCFALPKPPEGAVTHTVGNVTYYSGTVYLRSHDDTLRLKDLGFLSLSFDSRAFGSFKYRAEWPDSVIALPLPDYMNGLDYDVAAQDPKSKKKDRDQALTLPGPKSPSRWVPGEDRNYVTLDESERESQRRMLERISVTVHCYPRPRDGKPDTVIAGKEYVRGTVILRSVADSSQLLSYGFFGFDPAPQQGVAYDNSRAGGSLVEFYGYRAYWPMEVPVIMLPECVHGLRVDHARQGTAVVIERKMPVE